MRVLILALCMTIVGCGGGSDTDAENEAEEDKETVFDPLVGNIDKAKDVENQLMEHKDRTDQAVAESELSVDESEDDQDD